MSSLRKIMLITGASGGIGADLARVAAQAGHDLALVARNRAALDTLADALAALPGQQNPRPLVFDCDLSKPGAVAALAQNLAAAGATPDIVVNNAGYGALGPAADGDLDEQLGMIDLNIRALTEMSLVFAKPLIESKGRLLNVASVAAFMPGPGMAIYYASKAYVLSFSEALSAEMEQLDAPPHRPPHRLCRDRLSGAGALFQEHELGQVIVDAFAGSRAPRYEGMMARKRMVTPAPRRSSSSGDFR